jgi:hypothetical protein
MSERWRKASSRRDWVVFVAIVLLSAPSVYAGDKKSTPKLEWPRLVEELRRVEARPQDKVLVLDAFLASNQVPFTSMELALVFRARDDLANGRALAAGSLGHRMSVEEFEQLARVLQKKKLLNEKLTGEAVGSWQRRLDEAWSARKTCDAVSAVSSVIDEAAPIRDETDAPLMVNVNPKRYLAEVLQVSAEDGARAHDNLKLLCEALMEVVAEADLLAAECGGEPALEEFQLRYPQHPFSASVLFSLGRLRQAKGEALDAEKAFARLRTQFPSHPLTAKVPPPSRKGIADEK